MAPKPSTGTKKAPKPTKHPGEGGSSTAVPPPPEPSSQPTMMEVRQKHLATLAAQSRGQSYDQNRFQTFQAEQLFQMIYSKRGVVCERPFDPESFRGPPFDWADEIERRGWVSLAQYSGVAIGLLCREFVSNIHTADNTPGNEKLVSWVRGIPMMITPDTFVQIYGVPRVANAQFVWPGLGTEVNEQVYLEITKPGAPRPGDIQLKKKFLKERYLPLFIWTCHTILPLVRLSEVSLMRAQLLWAIGTGLTIDLPHYMFMNLYALYTNPAPLASIPHSCLLTKFIKGAKVKIPGNAVQEKSKGKITLKTISKSQAQYARQGGEGGEGFVLTKEAWEGHVKESKEAFEQILKESTEAHERITKVEAVQGEQMTILHRQSEMLENILEFMASKKTAEEDEDEDDDDDADDEE